MSHESRRDAGANLFVDRYVSTLDDFECLLLLIQTPDRWWDAATLGRELHIPASQARVALERFAAGNLLEIRITDEVPYQYRPGEASLREAGDAFAEVARINRLRLVKRVTERGSRNIRDFADAFRIRRDDHS